MIRIFLTGNLPVTALPATMNHFRSTDKWQSRIMVVSNPDDRMLEGFRLTHQPSPWVGDFATFIVQPISGNDEPKSIYQARTSYRQQTAVFQPDYLRLESERYHLTTQLVPSIYGATLKITYQQDRPGLLLHLPRRPIL